MAQEQNGWQFDSLGAESDSMGPDAQRIYQVVLKMLDCWNAHDIEGHLEVYWKSPELLVVVDSEQFNGWQQLHDSYINGYPDRNAMGFIEPKHIQVKLLKPDLALALTWWSVSFPSSKQKAVGNTTMNLQKFDDGWKIVASHTSIAEMCFVSPIPRTRRLQTWKRRPRRHHSDPRLLPSFVPATVAALCSWFQPSFSRDERHVKSMNLRVDLGGIEHSLGHLVAEETRKTFA